MLIGLDFDNTIVDYDLVFYERAVERGLVPETVDPTKTAVRAWLRAADREAVWTELQGDVYGRCMLRARPAAGVLDFLESCSQRRLPLALVSHKTLYPYLGPQVNLHEAAREWLAHHNLAALGLPPERCFFERTKEAKLARIATLGCTHFVDDLEDILLAPGFPEQVEKLHYLPQGSTPGASPLKEAVLVPRQPGGLLASRGLLVCPSWEAIGRHVMGASGGQGS